MLNIASFITPLAVRPDPNGAAANLVNAEHNWANERQQKAQLGEETRHAQAEEGIQQGHLNLAKQEHADTMGQHEKELHVKLVDWAMGVLDKEGLDKAKEIAGPVLDAAGIGVDFGGQSPATAGQVPSPSAPAEVGADDDGFAKLQAVQAANAAKEGVPEAPGETPSFAPRPGESLSAYVARGKSQVAKEEPAPTTEELDKEATEGPAKAATDEVVSEAEGQPKWRLFNKRTGETYGLIDPAKVDAINQKRAASRGAAYEKGLGGTTPQEIGAGFMGGARNESDLETRYGHAEHFITQNEKTKRASLVGKGGGPAFTGKGTASFNSNARSYMHDAMATAGMKDLNKQTRAMEQAASQLGSDTPAEQRVGLQSIITGLHGKTSSDREMARFLNANGQLDRLQGMVNEWIANGKLPDGLREAMKQMAANLAKFYQFKAQQIADKASNEIMDSPVLGGTLGQLTPQQRELIRAPIRNQGLVDTDKDPNDEAKELGF